MEENKQKLALEMQDCRPLDICSTEFADWQTAVEKSQHGNDGDFLAICYSGLKRLTNELEVESCPDSEFS